MSITDTAPANQYRPDAEERHAISMKIAAMEGAIAAARHLARELRPELLELIYARRARLAQIRASGWGYRQAVERNDPTFYEVDELREDLARYLDELCNAGILLGVHDHDVLDVEDWWGEDDVDEVGEQDTSGEEF